MWTTLMARLIKPFRIFRKLLRTMGIHLSEHNRNGSIKSKCLQLCLIKFIFLMSSMAFFIFRAETINEYGESFYVSVTEMAIASGFYSIISNLTSITSLIRKIDALMQKSYVKIISLFIWWKVFSENLVVKTHLHDCNRTWNCETISAFISELNDPATRPLFLETNQRMDRIANWVYFIYFRLTLPIMVLSDSLGTLGNYFILNMGSESYFLFAPILYVRCILHYTSRVVL